MIINIQQIRSDLYATMEIPSTEDNQGWYYEVFMMALIFANAVAMILGTVPAIQQQYDWFLMPFEVFSIAIFTVEYILLLWVCTENPDYADHWLSGRIRYALTPMALINMISVLPAFVPVLLPYDLRALRLFRMFRFFRILKISKYSDSLQTLIRVLDAKKEQLFMTLVIIVLLVVMASIFIFYAENGNNPSPAFDDIPSTIWWGLVKLSPMTNESGYPITSAGKMIASGLALLEIGIFAIPAGILASAFEDESDPEKKKQEEKLKACESKLENKNRQLKCPHCGKNYSDEQGS